MEPEIKASLDALLAAIARSDGAEIAGQMERLDGFLARGQAAGTLDPQLEHFLAKRSYAKARQYLDGDSSRNLHASNPKTRS
jgi:hypothetical protein